MPEPLQLGKYVLYCGSESWFHARKYDADKKIVQQLQSVFDDGIARMLKSSLQNQEQQGLARQQHYGEAQAQQRNTPMAQPPANTNLLSNIRNWLQHAFAKNNEAAKQTSNQPASQSKLGLMLATLLAGVSSAFAGPDKTGIRQNEEDLENRKHDEAADAEHYADAFTRRAQKTGGSPTQ